MENEKKIKEPFDPERTPQPSQIIEPEMENRQDRYQPATPNEKKDQEKNENQRDSKESRT